MDTIGNLIDQLTVTNIRIWMEEDRKRDAFKEKNIALRNEIIVKATEVTNYANQRRNDLIQEIDERLNEIADGKKQKLYKQGATKMYGKS